MALNRAHTSAKAGDVAKLPGNLLLNKSQVCHPPMRIMAVSHLTIVC